MSQCKQLKSANYDKHVLKYACCWIHNCLLKMCNFLHCCHSREKSEKDVKKAGLKEQDFSFMVQTLLRWAKWTCGVYKFVPVSYKMNCSVSRKWVWELTKTGETELSIQCEQLVIFTASAKSPPLIKRIHCYKCIRLYSKNYREKHFEVEHVFKSSQRKSYSNEPFVFEL